MTFPKVNEITLNIFRRTAQAVLLACAFAMLADGAIQAATLTVTKTADTNDGSCDQDCSLREAIAAANPAGGDEIVFASPLFDTPQTVSLSPAAGFQALLIDKNLTIRGRGANLLTVRRAPETPNTFRFRIFEIGTATVSISGLTVTGGNTAADAGGISGFGSTLTITDCHITGNVADGRGGGIRNVQGGSLTVINSTVSNNISNSASPGGGGIHSENGGLTITNSTVSGNVKTGGTNNGGGIATFFSTTVVSNSTVTNNRADGANSAGGIYRQGNTATIRNTIIAANQNNNSTPDVFAVAPGAFTSDGFNLIGSSPAGTGFADGVNQDKVGTVSSPLNPRLDALGNYGGTTPTHRLQSNSPALDQGHSGGSTRDQRGSFRPADNINIVNAANGDGSDIGAYEAEARLIVTSTADTPTGTCDSDCTLREAILAAGAGNTIEFSPLFDTPQVITLSSAAGFRGLIIAGKSLAITGKGANLLTIRRDPAATALFSVFRVINANFVLSGVTITGGSAQPPNTYGGGISSDADSTLTINASHITGNTVSSSASNLGGGISNSGGRLFINESTVSNNVVMTDGFYAGGGIYTGGPETIIKNSTVSGNTVVNLNGNTSDYNGGGIFNDGVTTIRNTTVTDNGAVGANSAGGIYSLAGSGGLLNIGSTIAAGNRSSSTVPDVAGSAFASQGYNLIGNVGMATVINEPTDQKGNSTSPINPLLQPLGNYGGTTPTHALLAGSPAIDKGKSFGSTTDQRGALRPFDNPAILPAPGGDNSDIGAYEASAFAPLVVTKIDDTNDGTCNEDCSLREAIAAAVSGNEIVFASPLFDSAQVITLSDAAGFRSLVVNKNITITGKGAHLLTVRRNPASAVNFRILTLNQANLVLTGMTISGGRDFGSGIRSGGILVNSDSDLTINACHITDNEVLSSSQPAGGGIYSQGNTLVINGSTISNNRVIIGNSQPNSGGGIYTITPRATINNSTISGNTVTNANGVSSDRHGGGIYNADILTIRNSTVTDNGAVGLNSASGIYSSFSVTLGNTIVAGNRSNSTIRDVNADISNGNRFTSQGYNLIGNAPTGMGFSDGVNNDLVGTGSSPLDPGLDALGNYGGTTPSHRLLSNSPAIDKGNSFGLITDQRGSLRPFDFSAISNAPDGDGADIGAFEMQSAPTAASVQVSGRVWSEEGRGLRNAQVTLTDMNGNARAARTGAFGYFRFAAVPVGETYIISVTSKRSQFAPQTVLIYSERDDINFTPNQK